MAHLAHAPSALDLMDGQTHMAMPSPCCSIPPTPSPYGSHRISLELEVPRTPYRKKSPPALTEDAFASPAPCYDVPPTPSPHGGNYAMGVTGATMLTRPTVGELNYRSLQPQMPQMAPMPPPPAPAALPLHFAHPHMQAASQVPKFAPPVLPPQLSFEVMFEGDETPPAPAYLPESATNAGSGTYLAEYLRQQLVAESTLRQQLVAEEEEDRAHGFKIKNTFIDSGLQRSPSFEQLRLTKSCPGSRLPTPKCEAASAKLGLKASLEDFETMLDLAEKVSQAFPKDVETDDAAGVSFTEKAHQDKHDRMVSPKISLQAAAWQGQQQLQQQQLPSLQTVAWQGPDQLANNAKHQRPSTGQVLSLEHMLAFQGQERYSAPYIQDPYKAPYNQEPTPAMPRGIPEVSFRRPEVIPEASSISRLASKDSVSKALLPRLGSPDLPSVGSLGHHIHRCKPCAFVRRSGCSNGVQCNFCHLCEPGEKKRRRKEKRALIGAARKLIA